MDIQLEREEHHGTLRRRMENQVVPAEETEHARVSNKVQI